MYFLLEMIEIKVSNYKIKKILYASLIISALLVIAVIVLSVLLAETKQNVKDNICLNKSCIKAGKFKKCLVLLKLTKSINNSFNLFWLFKASSILENIDESVDPCENFFEFSCGNFVKNQRIQDDQTKISEFSKLRDTATYSIAGNFRD